MEDKNKEELITELKKLLKQIAELEETAKEQRNVEQILRGSLEKLDSIVNTIPDIIYKLDIDGTITFVNDAVKQYGYTPEELYGKDILDLVHPEDKESVQYHINERRTGNRKTRSFELRLLTKQHSPGHSDFRTMNILSVPFLILEAGGVYDGDPHSDNFLGTLGIARDITEHKLAREELRKAKSYAQNIIDSSLDMIVSVDKDRRIVEFNKAACETFGYSREEIIGKHIGILYSDEKEGDKVVSETMKNGTFIGEIQNVRKNGDIFTCFLSAAVMRDENGEIIGAVGNSREISGDG